MKYMKELERLQSGPFQLTDYETGQVERLRSSLQSPDDCGGWVALSRSGNGFVREVAVRALSACASVDALAALLERLNDWVPQVRQQAIVAVERYLVPECVDLLLQVLVPLMSLANKQRMDHGAILARVRDVMKTPQARVAVEKAFVGCQGKVARFLFGVLREGATDHVALLEMALAHREMTVRQMAVEDCTVLPAGKAIALLERAFETPGASVRVKALRALLTLIEDPRAHLRVALLDASGAMRCLGRWAAPRWQLDCREVLLARLAEPLPSIRHEWLGLIGLAKELNDPQADAMLRQALASPLANVRLPALEALGERGLMQQISALDDPSDKVFSGAVTLLGQQPWSSVDESLEVRLNRQWHELPDRRRMALLSLKPYWRQVEYLLRRHQQATTDVAYWRERIGRWCEARYPLVDPQTPKALREELLQRLHDMEGAGELKPGTMRRLR